MKLTRRLSWTLAEALVVPVQRLRMRLSVEDVDPAK